jgi:plasmid stabilization system protein ParE
VKVRWHPRSRRELTDIYDYIVKSGSPLTALAYASAIEAYANSIGRLPYSGRPRDDLRKGIRVRHFKSVAIAYEIVDGSVRIRRIIHHARDYERVLRRDRDD